MQSEELGINGENINKNKEKYERTISFVISFLLLSSFP